MIVKCELWHYNHNHDKLGRFSVSPSGYSGKGTIKELNPGDKVYRISSQRNSFGGTAAYGSATKEDNDKWARELTQKNYSQDYTVTSKIKIADETTVGKIYAEKFLKTEEGRKKVIDVLKEDDPLNYDPLDKKAIDYFLSHPDKSVYEVPAKGEDDWGKIYALDKSLTDARAASSIYALNPDSEVAQEMTKALKKAGYTAISDVRGYGIADNPIIFLDKSQLQLAGSSRIVNSYDRDKYKGVGRFNKKGRKERDQLIKERKYRTDYEKY